MNERDFQAVQAIQQAVAEAHEREHETHELATYLRARLPHLHRAITLPETNPQRALWQFAVRYIDHAPDFLLAVGEWLAEVDHTHRGGVFIRIALEFFLNPPEVTSQRSGLLALLDKAYLAHRVMEEINDRLLVVAGTPLIPMDMTRSNLVVHALLEEHYANELDLAVHYAVETLFEHPATPWQGTMPAAMSMADLQRWPCMAGDSAVYLDLSDTPHQAESLH